MLYVDDNLLPTIPDIGGNIKYYISHRINTKTIKINLVVF